VNSLFAFTQQTAMIVPSSIDIEIETARPNSILVVNRSATFEQLPTVIPETCGVVWDRLRAAGITENGRNVTVYVGNANAAIDMQIGVEVDGEACRKIEWSEGMYVTSTPIGDVAHAVYMGDYADLYLVHRSIAEWSNEVGRALAGPSWEVYGHWSDDPTKLRTDVYYLLA
jgi:effector-binding domain-containing protein